MKVKVNDTVTILAGKDRGKTGKITKISRERVTVQGINKHIKHVKKRGETAGERIEFFAPIHISNVAIADPKSGKPTRIGFKMDGNDKVRIAKKSGEIIAQTAKKKKTAKAEPTPDKK
jgi:large subunit ribosomal protein L24